MSQKNHTDTEENKNVDNDTTTKDVKSTKKVGSKSSFLGHILCGSFICIFNIIFILLILLGTNFGQRALIQFVDKLSDNLNIESISGGLQDGLELKNINFKNPIVNVNIKKVDLKVNLICLFSQKVCVDNLKIEQPNIILYKIPNNKKSTHSKEFKIPVDIQANNLNINDLSFKFNQLNIKLGQFTSGISVVKNQTVNLLPTNFKNLNVILNKNNVEENKAKNNISNQIDWVALQQKLTKPIITHLDFLKLPFDLNVMQLSGENFKFIQGNKELLIKKIITKGFTNSEKIEVKTLSIQSNIADINTHGIVTLSNNYPLDMDLQVNIPVLTNTEIVKTFPKLKPFVWQKNQLNLQIKGNLKEDIYVVLNSQGIIPANFNGKVNLTKERTPFIFSLSAKELHYPLTPNIIKSYKLQDIHLSLKGNLLNYAVRLSAKHNKDNQLPQSYLDVYAQGGLTQLEIKQSQLQVDKGKTDFKGRLNWRNGLKWKTNLNLNNFKFGSYILKDLPGDLSGNIFAYGIVRDGDWDINVPEVKLYGQLSHRPFLLTTHFKASKDNPLELKDFLLDYDENHIRGKGYLNDHSHLDFNINAPDLKGLLPHLNATLLGEIKINGSIQAPVIYANLRGKNIKFKDISLKNFELNTDIQNENMIQGNLNFNLQHLKLPKFKIDQLILKAKGNEKQHNITLRSEGDPVGLDFDLQGSFDRIKEQWKGQLSSVEIASSLGVWRPNKIIDVDYRNLKQQAFINPHCWESQDAKLCFSKELVIGKEGQVLFNLQDFDLSSLKAWIKKNPLYGLAEAKGKIDWFKDKPLQATLNITSYNLDLKQKVDYRTLKLNIPKVRFLTRLKDNQLNVQGFIHVEQQGDININIRVKDIKESKNLTGALQVNNISLDILKQFFSRGENISGDIFANLKLSGNLQTPNLNGKLSLNRFKANMKNLPFNITDGDMQLNFLGNYSTLTGLIKTKESQLNINGKTSWENLDNWSSELNINGQDFFLDIPLLPTIAKLKISPDVHMKAEPGLLQLSGNINIPWARINIESLPDSGIPVSPDLVILDGPNKTKENKLILLAKTGKTHSGLKIQSDLKITIGDNVELKAYGLNTHLTGLLSVNQEKDIFGLYGQVNLDRGSYKSFGQDLIIRKGNITFTGIPTKPALNVEAIRNPEAMENRDITVGIIVSGYANKPKVKVFSNPIMSQDQAFSYLLTGHSIENTDGDEGGSLGAALLAMSLSQTGTTVGNIGKAFGIQNLNLGTSGVGNSSKVEVSGNLTRNLQVKYGVGLFDGLAQLTLRYRLLPKLYLQTVSGIDQAVDLLYQFEI